MAVQSIGGMRAARHRRRLAATLRRFVAEAHDPLALVLSSSPRGLAMARSLLTAPDSPALSTIARRPPRADSRRDTVRPRRVVIAPRLLTPENVDLIRPGLGRLGAETLYRRYGYRSPRPEALLTGSRDSTPRTTSPSAPATQAPASPWAWRAR